MSVIVGPGSAEQAGRRSCLMTETDAAVTSSLSDQLDTTVGDYQMSVDSSSLVRTLQQFTYQGVWLVFPSTPWTLRKAVRGLSGDAEADPSRSYCRRLQAAGGLTCSCILINHTSNIKLQSLFYANGNSSWVWVLFLLFQLMEKDQQVNR